MANITVPGLPAKTGTILDAAYLHLNESSVDKKVTIAQLLAKIEAQYSADIVTFLGSANKAEGRANLSIDRRVTVDNVNYTILATDKVVAQIGTMSAARTFSLPAASTVQAGAEIIVIDESGSVDSTNKIIVQRDGTDTIDGATSIDVDSSYGTIKLICDGTDSWKIANPPQASSTLKGIVELLTNAELAAGTDTTRAATASTILSLFASSSQSTNGYIRIPINISGAFDEIIIQWGTFNAGNPSTTLRTFNLNLTYPNANLGVFTQQTQWTGSGSIIDVTIETITTSQFTSRSGVTNQTIRWFSIGY